MTTISIRPDERDPFYSASNMRQLKRADKQIRSGRVAEKTMEELEALDKKNSVKMCKEIEIPLRQFARRE